ncbi:DUF2607 family protein [Hydrogenovibrio marinus]|uniref:Uncharacterized protein n=1 Tax=Hydrogenovibrio marinus TaxID=28885 RepID=A0A067A1M1_HYDMR|nr:DUF2607 family protein [Hydrogenovibrio marinus]KDN96225.1 hypothetical protein EI16_08055 [Hydrogenovibrio marinus]BBN60594.1 hypothetical protein HVMH_2188 [Hydrogenovibrio marinus]
MNQSLIKLSTLRRALQSAWHSGRMVSRIAVLLALFLFAKTAGLIHDEVHPFHHHTDQCEIYQAMAHPVSDDVYEVELHLFKPVYALQASEAVSQVYTTTYPAFWGRAPPFLSV